MKKLLPIIVALLVGAGTAVAAPTMGTSGAHDLDALWATAQTTYDLTKEDAVLLLESRRVEISPAGDVATTVHRVVWIGTAAGLRAHADLRVPWNSATCTLDVAKLRTWREGRWWPDAEKLSDTAVVHTLPYAVDHADDYTAMRETMLLHDGVELPCIMETEYTITERGLPGADDVFVLAQRDPAVLVQLAVTAPGSRSLHHRELNGAPAPTRASGDVGRLTLTWTLQPAAALRLPLTTTPAAYEPTVVWSTWTDERALGDAWTSAFWEAAVPPPAVAGLAARGRSRSERRPGAAGNRRTLARRTSVRSDPSGRPLVDLCAAPRRAHLGDGLRSRTGPGRAVGGASARRGLAGNPGAGGGAGRTAGVRAAASGRPRAPAAARRRARPGRHRTLGLDLRSCRFLGAREGNADGAAGGLADGRSQGRPAAPS